jgi:hypothetical protein
MSPPVRLSFKFGHRHGGPPSQSPCPGAPTRRWGVAQAQAGDSESATCSELPPAHQADSVGLPGRCHRLAGPEIDMLQPMAVMALT